MIEVLRYGDLVLDSQNNFLTCLLPGAPLNQMWGIVSFAPAGTGSRRSGRIYYRKIDANNDLASAVTAVRGRNQVGWCPQLGTMLVSLAASHVKRIIATTAALERVLNGTAEVPDGWASDCASVVSLLESAYSIGREQIGLTGSGAAELATEKSDIDLVMHCPTRGKDVLRTVRELRKLGRVQTLDPGISKSLDGLFRAFFKVPKGAYPQDLIARGRLDFKFVFRGRKVDLRLVDSGCVIPRLIRRESPRLETVEGVVGDSPHVAYAPSVFTLYPTSLNRDVLVHDSLRVVSLLACTQMLRPGDRVRLTGDSCLIEDEPRKWEMILTDSSRHGAELLAFGSE